MLKKFPDLKGSPAHRRRTYRFLLLILLLAALPRIFLILQVSDNDFFHNDGHEYLEISRQLSRGNGFSLSFYRWHEMIPPDAEPGKVHPDFVRTPLFPLLGSALFFLPWDVTCSAKTVSLILSLLAVYCVFLLGRELAGRECGLWSAFLFAGYPYALYYSASWSTENLFLICLALSILFLLKALHGHLRNLPLCGFFLGLTALTRPTAVLLAVIFPGILWLRFCVAGALKWKREKIRFFRPVPSGLLLQTAGFLLVFLLVMFPWMYRNKQVGGTWNPATYYDGYIFWLSFSRIMTETYRTLDTPEYLEISQKVWNEEHEKKYKMLREKGLSSFMAVAEQWRKWGWEQIRQSPEDALRMLKNRLVHYWRMCPNLVFLKTWQIWLIRLYFIPVFILAFAGAAILFRRLELPTVLLPVFFGMLISIPFLFVLRFRFPFFAPYVCILSGAALAWVRLWAKKMKKICNPGKE